MCVPRTLSDLQAGCPIPDRWWKTQIVYIIPVVLLYRHWLRTMYGDRFHCRSTASLLRFRALYQVLPVPRLDAATRAFYGVLVWGSVQVQSSAVGYVSSGQGAFGVLPGRLVRDLLRSVLRLTLPDEPGGHNHLIQSINLHFLSRIQIYIYLTRAQIHTQYWQ